MHYPIRQRNQNFRNGKFGTHDQFRFPHRLRNIAEVKRIEVFPIHFDTYNEEFISQFIGFIDHDIGNRRERYRRVISRHTQNRNRHNYSNGPSNLSPTFPPLNYREPTTTSSFLSLSLSTHQSKARPFMSHFPKTEHQAPFPTFNFLCRLPPLVSPSKLSLSLPPRESQCSCSSPFASLRTSNEAAAST